MSTTATLVGAVPNRAQRHKQEKARRTLRMTRGSCRLGGKRGGSIRPTALPSPQSEPEVEEATIIRLLEQDRVREIERQRKEPEPGHADAKAHAGGYPGLVERRVREPEAQHPRIDEDRSPDDLDLLVAVLRPHGEDRELRLHRAEPAGLTAGGVAELGGARPPEVEPTERVLPPHEQALVGMDIGRIPELLDPVDVVAHVQHVR